MTIELYSLRDIDLEGIEIPFPHRTLHVRFQDQGLARTLDAGPGPAAAR